MSVKSCTLPQPKKALKHLIYVSHGCGMQFERFYSLNQKCSDMVCTLASGRTSLNSHNSGEVSVVVTM
jgi:hypothetical protein